MRKHLPDIVYWICIAKDKAATLFDLIDNPAFGVTDAVRKWLIETTSDSAALYELTEGNENCWSGLPEGLVTFPFTMPVFRRPDCEHAVVDSERIHFFTCPDSLRPLLKKLLTASRSELQELIRQAESLLRTHGFFVSLEPGDRFLPAEWYDSVHIKCRDFFYGWGTNGSTGIITNERLASRFQNLCRLNVKMSPVVLNNRFFPEETGRFFLFESSYPHLTNLLLEEQGVELFLCKKCMNVVPHHNEVKEIECKKRYSAYKKSRVLPRRYVPDTPWFSTQVYQTRGDSFFLKKDALDLLSDVEMSYAKIVEVKIID